MILNHDQETIIAQCTPQGSGALALLRISGLHAIEVATKLSRLASGKQLDQMPTHTVHYGYVVDHLGDHIDHVMFILMHGPRTFTGQNTVEITCHNNPFIINAIVQQALRAGARLAQEGEFTRRAVLNNKIDLIQAEAINELIHANTHRALKQSLAQLEGSFSSWITAMEKELIKALAFSEASFEFIDEEMEFGPTITDIIKSTLTTIESIKKNFDQQQHIRQGFRIALIGAVNAGKSSLFNALLNKKRAIVTDIAGTTRDTIEAGVYKNNNYWTLIDTAGLRQTDDSIEQEGIAKSLYEAATADIVLLIVDHSRAMTRQERDVYEELITSYAPKIILVNTKADMNHYENEPLSIPKNISVSSHTHHNLDLVEHEIEAKIAQLVANSNAPFLLNKRQYTVMIDLEKKLQAIQTMCSGSIQYELLSYHLNDALAHLSQLTGKTISEQGMDAIFKEFCIGK